MISAHSVQRGWSHQRLSNKHPSDSRADKDFVSWHGSLCHWFYCRSTCKWKLVVIM